MESQTTHQKQLVSELTREGCLLDKATLDELNLEDIELIKSLPTKPMFIDLPILKGLREKFPSQKKEQEVIIQERSDRLETSVEFQDYVSYGSKKEPKDFAQTFLDRYEKLKNILLRRPNLKDAVSITYVKSYVGKDVSIIGMVSNISKTRKGKFIITLEDPTGLIKVLTDELTGERVVLDEVIGASGKAGDGMIFSNEIVWPDIPFGSSVKKASDDIYATFISDTHFGSKYILMKKVNKFLRWINSNDALAKKVGYVLIPGDLIDGVGKYPGQRKNLATLDIYDQYKLFEEFLLEIPDHIQIIYTPGDHDVVRTAEPQPKIPDEFLPQTKGLKNIHRAPNPASVKLNVHDMPISVLMYHGFSYFRHVDGLPYLREYIRKDPTKTMKDLLIRRHLTPIYGSVQMFPEETDHLVINEVPDIFTMGHLHIASYSNYKGINLVGASTFQGITPFMKRVGQPSDPGKAILLNLKTRTSVMKMF